MKNEIKYILKPIMGWNETTSGGDSNISVAKECCTDSKVGKSIGNTHAYVRPSESTEKSMFF